jgi:hypothetical protein
MYRYWSGALEAQWLSNYGCNTIVLQVRHRPTAMVCYHTMWSLIHCALLALGARCYSMQCCGTSPLLWHPSYSYRMLKRLAEGSWTYCEMSKIALCRSEVQIHIRAVDPIRIIHYVLQYTHGDYAVENKGCLTIRY